MSFSADFTVGGWWGGPANDGAAPESAHGDRFGDQGHFVLTNATAATIESSSYSRSNASTLDVTLTPGFDYFVVGNVSLGADIGYENEASTLGANFLVGGWL